MRIGAHESVAGGLIRAFERAEAAGDEAVQIFTSSGRGWAETRRDPGEVREFAQEGRRRALPLLAHDSYLINLASAPGEIRRKSLDGFAREVERCEALGVGAVVMHPGAHVGAGTETGVARVADALRNVLRVTRGYRVRILLELTAGQGTCLGASFEELGWLLREIGSPRRTGVCFDTCHAFAAGYDWRSAAGYERMWREFDDKVGIDKIQAFHLNDSKRELGSRVDRHEGIGEGWIGEAPFRRLVRDPRFEGVPAVLELPPEMALAGVKKLKRWRRSGTGGYPRLRDPSGRPTTASADRR